MSITVLGRRDVKKRQELGGGSLSLKAKREEDSRRTTEDHSLLVLRL